MADKEHRPVHQHSDKDGHFRRKDSSFRNFIQNDPNAQYPAEKGRYVLYANYGCPWAHRTILVRHLKNLEDTIELVLTDFELGEQGWLFTGRNGSPEKEPLYGFTNFKQLYLKADPDYIGRYTVPCLWDKKTHSIVNNESSEIIRMFYDAFDDLIDPAFRESSKKNGELSAGFYPPHLRAEIDAMNEWVYHTINNGVYKCGFATTQEAYDANIYPLFQSLDRVEAHLKDPVACHGGPFLFGPHITEADIRLYTTIARFDAAYHTIFTCNLKTIRFDYPLISRWLRNLYWNGSKIPKGEAFKDTTKFDLYALGYAVTKYRHVSGGDTRPAVIPRGPLVKIDDWSEQDIVADRERQVAYQQKVKA